MKRTVSETPNHIESPSLAPVESASQKPWAQTALDQFLELWITPYIIKKQAEGIFPKPLELKVARVIFFPDGRENLVQVNEEACLNRLKLKDNISKEKGEPIYEHEINWSCTHVYRKNTRIAAISFYYELAITTIFRLTLNITGQ